LRTLKALDASLSITSRKPISYDPNTIANMMDASDYYLTLLSEDDVSLLEFDDLANAPDTIFSELAASTSTAAFGFEVDSFIKVTDDEINCDSSVNSDLIFFCGEHEMEMYECPSMEEMMKKLSDSMKRSAQTRKAVFNTIVPGLKKSLEYQRKQKRSRPTPRKRSARKAKRPLCSDCVSTKYSIREGGNGKDSIICDFLRA
jgi:hypothetical protein